MMRALLAVVCLKWVPLLAGCWLPASIDVPIGIRWAFGGVITMLIAVALHAIGVGAVPTIAVMLIVAVAGGLRIDRLVTALGQASGRDTAIAVLVFVPILAAALFTLATPVDAGDAVMAWYAKARALLDWQPLPQLPYAEYPDLGMMAWSLLLRVTGWAYEPAARLVFLAIYAAFACSLPDLLDKPLSRHAVWIVPLGVLATFDLRLITNGYQDASVGAVAGIAAILLGRHLQTGDRPRAALGLMFAGTVGLFKLEGAVLGGILVVAWLTVQGFRPLRTREFFPGLAMYVVLAMFWPSVSWARALPLTQGQYSAFEGSSLADIPGRLVRLPTIANALIATGPRFLVPLAALLVLAAGAFWLSSASRPLMSFFALGAAGHTLSIVTVFLLTNLDVSWHLATAFDRLVLQQVIALWTPAMIAAAVCLAELSAPGFPESRRSASHPAL